MDAGIASTILFVYPVMVAVIMATCFREKVTASTVTAIILALAGIGLLYRGDAGVSLSAMGVLLVMVSSLTYAVYIVVVNQSSIRMSSLKLTFYVLLICMLSLLAYSFTSPDLHLMLPPSPRAWFFACWLGLVPTVLSLVLMTVAVHEVGATPTAITPGRGAARMPPDCYHPRCGSTTRTCDLQVMSLTSYQLLYPAMFFICGCKDKANFLNCQIIKFKIHCFAPFFMSFGTNQGCLCIFNTQKLHKSKELC